LSNFLDQTFKEVLPPVEEEGNRVMRWQAYNNASAQNFFDNPVLDNMQQTFCSKVMFIR